MNNEINEFINLWMGKRLESIYNICEMLEIDFSDNLVLHGLYLINTYSQMRNVRTELL